MKITRLFLFSLVVSLFSCSEKDDPKPAGDGLPGAWSMTGLEYSGTSTATFDGGGSIAATFTGVAKNIAHTVTFTENPNEVISEGSYTIVLTTNTEGIVTTNEVPITEIFMDGTWSRDGDILTITNGSIIQEGTILKQTRTELEVESDLEEIDDSIEGVTVTKIVHAVYKFKRK